MYRVVQNDRNKQAMANVKVKVCESKNNQQKSILLPLTDDSGANAIQ